MPVPGQIYRVDPRDLNNNIAIGISLPFNGTAVFNMTYSTKDQIKNNLLNVLLTNKGERIENPNFGCDVRKFIFEFITSSNTEAIKRLILDSISYYVPEVVILDIQATPDEDHNTIMLKIDYQIKISGNRDNIIVTFT